MTAEKSMASYQLRSDLARVCLPRPVVHHERALAWVNSICLLFLAVAISGVRPKLPEPKNVTPLDQPVPIILQPIAPALPQAPAETKQAAPSEDKAVARVVVVTPNSPAINFSVPTIGNVVVPNAVAAPPPVAPLALPVAQRPEPTKAIGSTGQGGDRPQPPYPEMALRLGQQGAVILLLTVDDSGQVMSATVKETSGSAILDRSAREFVRRHWIVPPGARGRLFQATISYLIRND